MKQHNIDILGTQVRCQLSETIKGEKLNYTASFDMLTTESVKEWITLRFLGLDPVYPMSIDTAQCSMYFTAFLYRQINTNGVWQNEGIKSTSQHKIELTPEQITKFLILSETTGFPFPPHFVNTMVFWATAQATIFNEPNPIYVSSAGLVSRTPIEPYNQNLQPHQPLVAYLESAVSGNISIKVAEYTGVLSGAITQVGREIVDADFTNIIGTDTYTVTGLEAGTYNVQVRDAVGLYHFNVKINAV